MLHQRRHRRQRPVRRAGLRGRDPVVPVAHVLCADRIDRAVAEGRQYPASHRVRVVLPCRRWPALCTVGKERWRECPHRLDRRRPATRLRSCEECPRRMPRILDRQRIEGTERPPDDGAVATPMHDPRLAPVRARPQSEARRRTVPQHGLAPVYRREGARTRPGDLDLVRQVPIPSDRFGRDRRGADVPSLGNTQDTPGNRPGSEFGRVGCAALKRRAGCKLLQPRGFQRLTDARAACDFSTPEAQFLHTRSVGPNRS